MCRERCSVFRACNWLQLIMKVFFKWEKQYYLMFHSSSFFPKVLYLREHEKFIVIKETILV